MIPLRQNRIRALAGLARQLGNGWDKLAAVVFEKLVESEQYHGPPAPTPDDPPS